MADIQEIALDIKEELKDIPEIEAPEPAEIEAPEPEVIPIKPKAKGRPKGSLNKGPSKPRPKKIAIVNEASIEEDYEPSSPKRNLKIPTDPDSSDIAAAMLRLLQDQTFSRQARKQRLYKSWFE